MQRRPFSLQDQDAPFDAWTSDHPDVHGRAVFVHSSVQAPAMVVSALALGGVPPIVVRASDIPSRSSDGMPSPYQPSRVYVQGPEAERAVLGVAVDATSSRAHTTRASGVPVFVIPVAGGDTYTRARARKTAEWARDATPWPPLFGTYAHLESLSDVQDALAYYRSVDRVTVDTETWGHLAFTPSPRAVVLGLSVCTRDTAFTSIISDSLLASPRVHALLSDFFAEIGEVNAHNLKFDARVIRRDFGVWIRHTAPRCTMVDRALLDSTATASLAACAPMVGVLGHKDLATSKVEAVLSSLVATRAAVMRAHKIKRTDASAWACAATRAAVMSDLIDALLGLGFEYLVDDRELRATRPELPVTDLAAAMLDPVRFRDRRGLKAFAYALAPRRTIEDYCAADTETAARLAVEMDARYAAESPALSDLRRTVSHPAALCAARQEDVGFAVDVTSFNAVSVALAFQKQKALGELQAAGLLEPSKPAAVATFLYERLKLPIKRRTATGMPSVDAEALLEMKGVPAVASILAFREASKFTSTFVAGFIDKLGVDGRVHPSYFTTGTETGRWSAKDPNIMTLPSRGEWARLFKAGIVAPPGYSLVVADLSQIELRVACELADDEVMRAIYLDGRDVHGETAKLLAPTIFGVQWEKPTAADEATRPEWAQKMSDIRRAMKAVVFGLLYGKTPRQLAEELGITLAQAQAIEAGILGRYRKLGARIKASHAFAKSSGYTRTWWRGSPSRRRPVAEVFSAARAAHAHGLRAAWNTEVQGTAADLCSSAIVELDAWGRDLCAALEEDVYRILYPVHDAIVAEVADAHVKYAVAMTERIMTSRPLGQTPLAVEVKVGKSLAT